MKTITIDPDDIAISMDVTAWYLPSGQSGQGGIVTEIHDDHIVVSSGTAHIRNEITWDSVHHWSSEIPYDADECLNHNADCRGPVDLHWTGGSRSWPRCEFHQDKRMASRENSMERYADSDVVPGWFDPADAGERWDED